VRSGLGSNGKVTSEVDQVRALREEEVIVEVRLHQGQGFIGAFFFFFGSFRMLLRFQFSECVSSPAKE
jgi:hypothetical protein